MRYLGIALLSTLVLCTAITVLLACRSETSDISKESYSESAVTSTVNQSACPAQQILDSIYEKVTLKDGRIYLVFGARGTLTEENFTRLILKEQLGLTDDRFSFVIDQNLLSVLRGNNAYGGIGYGQEWIASVKVSIRDNETGEVSAPADLVFTFLKSSDGDAKLKQNVQVITDEPDETVN